MKAFLILSAFLLVFALASCGGDDDDDTGGDDDIGDDDNDDSGDDADDDGGDDDDIATEDTWTDSSSGLSWQVTPTSDYMTWADAMSYCETLTLDGGGWRLPTISELRSLIRGCDATVSGGACGVTDDCLDQICWNDPCLGCDPLAGPGSGGAYWPEEMTGIIFWYWSSSPLAYLGSAWGVHFGDGGVNFTDIASPVLLVRCVR